MPVFPRSCKSEMFRCEVMRFVMFRLSEIIPVSKAVH
jgi:hypothetical protein